MADPQNGWFTLEIPIEIDDLEVPPFQETSIWEVWFGDVAKQVEANCVWAAWKHEEDIDAFCAQLIVDGSKARVFAGWCVIMFVHYSEGEFRYVAAQKTSWKDKVGMVDIEYQSKIVGFHILYSSIARCIWHRVPNS